MKRTHKITLIASSLAIALGLSAAAVAGPGHFKGGMQKGFGFHLLRLAERLDLTEEQEVQAVRLRRKMRQKAKANRQAMRSNMDAVLVEMEKQDPDPAKLHRMIDEASARMTKMMHESVDEYLVFHQTLDTNQRKELVRHAREIKARRAERRGQFKKR